MTVPLLTPRIAHALAVWLRRRLKLRPLPATPEDNRPYSSPDPRRLEALERWAYGITAPDRRTAQPPAPPAAGDTP